MNEKKNLKEKITRVRRVMASIYVTMRSECIPDFIKLRFRN